MFNAAAAALVLVIARVLIALKSALFRRGWVLLFPKSNLSKVDNTFGHIGRA